MDGLRSDASQVLTNASTLATGDYAAADSAARFEAAKRAPEWLWLAAMEAAGHLQSRGSLADAEAIARLGSLAQQASLRLQSLDTTTDGELFFQWITKDALQNHVGGDAVAAIDQQIHRLEDTLRRELNRLFRLKGPDPRTSLPLLVARLCDLWARETGRRVTVNPFNKTEYAGVPQSQAGVFVCEVVDTLKPTSPAVKKLMQYSGRTSPPHLKSQLNCGPQAVHSAMRLYIKARNSNPAEQRQPPKKHTL